MLSEEFLPYFHFVSLDYKLSNGKTIIQDIFENLDNSVSGSIQMLNLWEDLEHKIDKRLYEYTRKNLNFYINTAEIQSQKMKKSISRITKRSY
jgi:alpha-glucuronidase